MFSLCTPPPMHHRESPPPPLAPQMSGIGRVSPSNRLREVPVPQTDDTRIETLVAAATASQDVASTPCCTTRKMLRDLLGSHCRVRLERDLAIRQSARFEKQIETLQAELNRRVHTVTPSPAKARLPHRSVESGGGGLVSVGSGKGCRASEGDGWYPGKYLSIAGTVARKRLATLAFKVF